MDPGRGQERPDLESPPSGADGGRRQRSPRFRLPLGTPLIWHIVSLLVGALFLMYVNRNQWFFGDEWDFLANRSVGVGTGSLFQPHNEHWSTSPMLIYGLLFRLTGLSSYAPYVAALVLANLAVVHLMWRVMLRGGVGPWIATAFCAAFIPFGPGAEDLLWAFQIGFVGSVALGLAFVLLADRDGRFGGRDVAGWGVGVLGLTFSGISVPLIGMAGLAAWLRRGFLAALVTISVPIAAFLAWFALAGSVSVTAHPSITSDSLRLFPQFVGRGLGAVLSWGTGTPLVGVFALALTVGSLVIRHRAGRSMPTAALASAAGGLLVTVLLAVARAPLGVELAESSRYVYIGAALFLPLSLIGVSDLAGRRLVATFLVAAVAVPWAVQNGRELVHKASLQADRERLIREQIVAAGTVFAAAELLRDRPEPVYSPDLDLVELELLLPRLPRGVTPSREALTRAALALQFSLTSEPSFQSSVPVSGLRAFHASLVVGADGCAEASADGSQPRLLVPAFESSSLGVHTTDALELEFLLSAGELRPDYGERFEVGAGETWFINTAMDEMIVGRATLIVRFPSRITICPVDASAAER
ncbi:MAG: hypothetical protein ACRDH9_12505 [Actinomycetota bacterium]